MCSVKQKVMFIARKIVFKRDETNRQTDADTVLKASVCMLDTLDMPPAIAAACAVASRCSLRELLHNVWRFSSVDLCSTQTQHKTGLWDALSNSVLLQIDHSREDKENGSNLLHKVCSGCC